LLQNIKLLTAIPSNLIQSLVNFRAKEVHLLYFTKLDQFEYWKNIFKAKKWTSPMLQWKPGHLNRPWPHLAAALWVPTSKASHHPTLTAVPTEPCHCQRQVDLSEDPHPTTFHRVYKRATPAVENSCFTSKKPSG
jgi:hypothetical protein